MWRMWRKSLNLSVPWPLSEETEEASHWPLGVCPRSVRTVGPKIWVLSICPGKEWLPGCYWVLQPLFLSDLDTSFIDLNVFWGKFEALRRSWWFLPLEKRNLEKHVPKTTSTTVLFLLWAASRAVRYARNSAVDCGSVCLCQGNGAFWVGCWEEKRLVVR